MRPERLALLGLFAPAMLVVLAGCDSGIPSGGPVPTDTPTPDAITSQYDVPATLTAITLAGSAWQTPVALQDMQQPPDLDACLYLTAEDVKLALGKPLEQNPRSATDTQASCTYSGDANYVTLTVYVLDSEAETAQLGSQSLDFARRYPLRGEFLPGLGDSATLARIFSTGTSLEQQKNLEQQIGWNVIVTQGRNYLMLKWYTDSFDEKDKVVDLTRKVLSRLK